jgi:hypothetical protein
MCLQNLDPLLMFLHLPLAHASTKKEYVTAPLLYAVLLMHVLGSLGVHVVVFVTLVVSLSFTFTSPQKASLVKEQLEVGVARPDVVFSPLVVKRDEEAHVVCEDSQPSQDQERRKVAYQPRDGGRLPGFPD